MTTTTVQFDETRVELSRPVENRPDLIFVTTDDGRRAVLGDGLDVFSDDVLKALSVARGLFHDRASQRRMRRGNR